jgi:hypothetical protein
MPPKKDNKKTAKQKKIIADDSKARQTDELATQEDHCISLANKTDKSQSSKLPDDVFELKKEKEISHSQMLNLSRME